MKAGMCFAILFLVAASVFGQEPKKADVIIPRGEKLTVLEFKDVTLEGKLVDTPRGKRLQFRWQGRTYQAVELWVKLKTLYQVFDARQGHLIPVQIPFKK